jgi:hypothetical protein
LTSVSSRLGFRAGTATPSGIVISFRPPRRCSRIGMRIVSVSTSELVRSVVTRRPPARVRKRPEWSLLARHLTDEAANTRCMQRDGDTVGRDVDALDQ